MATKSRYKVFTSTTAHPTGEWVEYYLRTSGDIVENGVTGTHNYITAGQYVSASLVALDTAVKAAYDHVPANVLTSDSTLNSAKLSGKVPDACLPDYIFGQMLYGGTLGASASATLSTNAKTKLGTTSTSITLTNNTTNITGYTSNEGIYYIVSYEQTFAGLDLKVGDWLISNGSGWTKVDNTDAILSWCGLTGNITTAQAKTALGGSIASGDTGFVNGGTIYSNIKSSPVFLNTVKIADTDRDGEVELRFESDIGGGVEDAAYISAYYNQGYGQRLVLHAEDGIGFSALEGTSRNHTVWFRTDEMSSDVNLNFESSDGTVMLHETNIDVILNSYADDNDSAELRFRHDGDGTNRIYDGVELIQSHPKYFLTLESEQALRLMAKPYNDVYAYIDTWALESNQTFSFPDDSGVLALTKNVPNISTQSAAPSSPKAGDIWIDTSN